MKALAVRWYAENPEYTAHYRAKNPDRVVAIGGLQAAKRRGATRPDCYANSTEWIDATVPVYALRHKLQALTGEPHHVDHVLAICLGGQHHPDNLAVITAKANLRKAGRELDEAVQRFRDGTLAATPEVWATLYDAWEALTLEGDHARAADYKTLLDVCAEQGVGEIEAVIAA